MRITIAGKLVEVDDSFTSLTPDEQNATVDEIASSPEFGGIRIAQDTQEQQDPAQRQALADQAAQFNEQQPVAQTPQAKQGMRDLVLSKIKDRAIDVTQGTVGLAQGVVGLADLAGGAFGVNVQKWSDQYFRPEDINSFYEGGRSAGGKESAKAVADAKGFWDTAVAYAENPGAIVSGVTQSAPAMAASVLSAAKYANALLKSKGIKAGTKEAIDFLTRPEVARKIAFAGSGVEGAQVAGQVQSEARSAGRTYGESAPAAIGAGIATTLVGGLIPSSDIEVALAKKMAGANVKQKLKESGKRVLKGSLKETGEETVQNPIQTIGSNVAEGREAFVGVPKSAAEGAFIGLGMGAPLHAVAAAGGQKDRKAPPPDAARNQIARRPPPDEGGGVNPPMDEGASKRPSNDQFIIVRQKIESEQELTQQEKELFQNNPEAVLNAEIEKTPEDIAVLRSHESEAKAEAAAAKESDAKNKADKAVAEFKKVAAGGENSEAYNDAASRLILANRELAAVTASTKPPNAETSAKKVTPNITGYAGVEKVTTPKGTAANTEFMVSDIDDIVTSNDEAYPQEFQPRKRKDSAASNAQIDDIAKNLDPAQLASSSVASSGAPISVNRGGRDLVLSGNGRTLALKKAFKQYPEQQQKYIDYWRERGVEVKGGQIVHRRISDDMSDADLRRFSIEANEPVVARMSAAEEAKATQDILTPDVMAHLANDDLTSPKNSGFVKAFMRGISPSRMKEFVSDDGKSLTSDGVRRIENAILAKAYGGSKFSDAIIDRATVSTNDNIKTITGAMMDAAPAIADLKQMIAEGKVSKDKDITHDLVSAIEVIAQSKSTNKNINSVVNNEEMFSGDGGVSEISKEIIREFYKSDKGGALARMAGRRQIADFLEEYAEKASSAREDQGSIFGDESPVSIMDIIKSARRDSDTRAERAEDAPYAKSKKEATSTENKGVESKIPFNQKRGDDNGQSNIQRQKMAERNRKVGGGTQEERPTGAGDNAGKARRTDAEVLASFGRAKRGEEVTFIQRGWSAKKFLDDTKLGGKTATPTALLGHYMGIVDVGNPEKYGNIISEWKITFKKPYLISENEFESLGGLSNAEIIAVRKSLLGVGYDGILVGGLNWAIVFEGKNAKAVENKEVKKFLKDYGLSKKNVVIRTKRETGATGDAQSGKEQVAVLSKKSRTDTGLKLSVEDIKKSIEKISPALAKHAVVVQSFEHLPKSHVAHFRREKENQNKINGYYSKGPNGEIGRAFIIADNAESIEHSIRTALHEIAGHKALHLFLGKDGRNLFRNVYGSKELSDLRKSVESKYKKEKEIARQDGGMKDYEAWMGEEMLAELAEESGDGKNPLSPEKQSILDKAIAIIRKLVQKVFGQQYTREEALTLLRSARKALDSEYYADRSAKEAAQYIKEEKIINGYQNTFDFDNVVALGDKKLSKKAASDNWASLTESRPVRSFKTKIDRINNDADAATFARDAIGNMADEVALVIMVDDKGAVVEVNYLSKGTVDAASVYPSRLTGWVASNKKATGVWFAHNHPSGVSDPSRADMATTNKIHDSLDKIGVPLIGALVVGESNGAIFFNKESKLADSGVAVQYRYEYKDAESGKDHPLSERVYIRNSAENRIKFTGPSSAIDEYKKNPSNAIYLLNSKRSLIGTLPLTDVEMKSLGDNGVTTKHIPRRILAAIADSNASAVIVTVKDFDKKNVASISRSFSEFIGDARVLDVVGGEISSGFDYVRSAAESGLMEGAEIYGQEKNQEEQVDFLGGGEGPVKPTDIAIEKEQKKPKEKKDTATGDLFDNQQFLFSKKGEGEINSAIPVFEKEKLRRIKSRLASGYRRWLTKEQGLPSDFFKAKMEGEGMESRLINVESRYHAAVFRNAIEAAYGKNKKYKDMSESQKHAMDRALRGEKVDLPDDVRIAILGMRDTLDLVSDSLVRVQRDMVAISLQDKTPQRLKAYLDWLRSGADPENTGGAPADAVAQTLLAKKIAANKGIYLNRSYQAFDDPKWMDKVLADKRVINNAMRALQAEGDDTPMATIKALLHEAKEKANPVDFIVSAGKKTGIFKKRKDISPEIRELLGEYKDPLMNFERSLSKMSNIVSSHHALMGMRAAGLESGTLTQEKTEDNYIEIKGGERLTPLSGLYTNPDIDQAIKDFSEVEVVPNWLRLLGWYNAAVKTGKTVYSPKTQVRNMLSNVALAIANGHINPEHLRTAIRVAVDDAYSPADMSRDFVGKLTERGVLHNSAINEELKAQISDALGGEDAKGFGRLLTLLAEIAQKTYGMSDNIWKVNGYLHELDRAHDRGMILDDAEKWAADRTVNTYPSYNLVARGPLKMRRLPVGAPFVSWPWEILRTTKNQIMYIRDDIKSGHKAEAAKRIVGNIVASGMFYALAKSSLEAMGLDDEDDEALKEGMPSYKKNAMIAYYRGDDGKLRGVDLSAFDPRANIHRVIKAGSHGEPEARVWAAIKEVLNPFFGSIQIGTKAITEAYSGVDGNRKPIWNEYDTDIEKGYKSAKHIIKQSEPGFIALLEELYRSQSQNVNPILDKMGWTWAMSEPTSKGGREYSVKTAATSALGLTTFSADPVRQLENLAYTYNDRRNDATASLTRVMTQGGTLQPSMIKQAADDYREAVARARFPISKFRRALEKGSLLSKAESVEAMARIIGKNEAYSVIAGVEPGLSNDKIKGIAEGAFQRLKRDGYNATDAGAETRKRVRLFMEFYYGEQQ